MSDNQKNYRKYIDFKCTKCGAEKQVRSDYKSRTTLCITCINESRKGKHEYYGTRIYYCWANMKQRCSHVGATGYEKYGGKGVSVCKEWQEFQPFLKWALSNGYKDNLTIDRRDGTKNYTPENCRWATYNTQSANTKLIHKTNTSGFRGVGDHRGKKWRAFIQVDRKSINLGWHIDILDAVFARDSYIIQNNLEHTMNFKSNSVEELKEIIATYKQKIKELQE